MIVHVADTAIELHSASSFLCELFHMFGDRVLGELIFLASVEQWNVTRHEYSLEVRLSRNKH